MLGVGFSPSHIDLILHGDLLAVREDDIEYLNIGLSVEVPATTYARDSLTHVSFCVVRITNEFPCHVAGVMRWRWWGEHREVARDEQSSA